MVATTSESAAFVATVMVIVLMDVKLVLATVMAANGRPVCLTEAQLSRSRSNVINDFDMCSSLNDVPLSWQHIIIIAMAFESPLS